MRCPSLEIFQTFLPSVSVFDHLHDELLGFFLPNTPTAFSINQLGPVICHPNTTNLKVDSNSIYTIPLGS